MRERSRKVTIEMNLKGILVVTRRMRLEMSQGRILEGNHRIKTLDEVQRRTPGMRIEAEIDRIVHHRRQRENQTARRGSTLMAKKLREAPRRWKSKHHQPKVSKLNPARKLVQLLLNPTVTVRWLQWSSADSVIEHNAYQDWCLLASALRRAE